MKSETELWKSLPGVPGVEVSTIGRVRTLDKVVSSENYTRFQKGRVLKQSKDGYGYLQVSIKVDGKQTTKKVHRLVAQTFLPNHNNLLEINHKDNNPLNNNASNLEWCTHEYNIAYREKYGTPAKDFVPKSPVYAVNLKTQETLWFESQNEAGRSLGIGIADINAVIKCRRKQASGYWFKEDKGNGIETDKDKLNDIVDGMRFRGGVFAVNLNTLEVSRFKSQHQTSRMLGINQGNISAVIKGKQKTAGGYWFTNADENADDAIKRKLKDIKGEV